MKYLLAVASVMLVLSGCSNKNDTNVEKQALDELRAEVRVVITDPERQGKALNIIDELSQELQLLRQKKAQRQAESRKLNANYDTTRAEFDAFINEKQVDIRLSQQRILEKRSALIAATTDEEWEQISDVRSDSIDDAINAVKPN